MPNTIQTCPKKFPERFVLMSKDGKRFWELDCAHEGRLRQGMLYHDCLHVEGASLYAWAKARLNEFKCVDGVYLVPYARWFDCPDFKGAVEETFKNAVNAGKAFSTRVRQGATWLTVICVIAHAIGANVPSDAAGTMSVIYKQLHDHWAGPGTKNFALYSQCVELLRLHDQASNTDKTFKHVLAKLDGWFQAAQDELIKLTNCMIKEHVAVLTLQANQVHAESIEGRMEMGGRVDRINAQQAELDHKMDAFKKDFAGQIFKIRASLDVLASQIIEIRAAVHVLEEGFREHERQLAQIWEQLATHSAEIDVLTSAHAATNSKVKELEAAVTTALKYLAAGSQEHQALEQRLAETQLLVQQQGEAIRLAAAKKAEEDAQLDLALTSPLPVQSDSEMQAPSTPLPQLNSTDEAQTPAFLAWEDHFPAAAPAAADPAPPGRKPLGPIDPSNKANLPQPPPSEACERGNTAPASAPASPSVTDVMAAVLHACCGSPLPKSPPATPATEGEGDTLPATEILLSPDIKLRIKMAVPVGAVITVLLAIAVYNYLKA